MSVSRRGFLTALAAGASVAVASRAASAAGVKHFEGYPGRFGLLHDTTLCTGCRSCEGACARVNELPEPPAAETADLTVRRRTTDTALTVVNRYPVADESGAGKAVFRKQQCMHCNEPSCATVCLVHAFTKTPEGPVLYDADVCMGCRYCVNACPYYALAYEYDEPLTPRVMRCTMCYPRIKEGKLPGCADACPTGAILFGPREELLAMAHERIRRLPDSYVPTVFGEHEFGGTSWLVLAGVPFGKLGLPEHVTHEPLPAIGTSYLSVVPLIVALYPGVLAAFYAFSKRKEELTKQEVETEVSAALLRERDKHRQQVEQVAREFGLDPARLQQALRQHIATEEVKP